MLHSNGEVTKSKDAHPSILNPIAAFGNGSLRDLLFHHHPGSSGCFLGDCCVDGCRGAADNDDALFGCVYVSVAPGFDA